MREDICVGAGKESLLPSSCDGVTLIQDEAVVMSDDSIKEVSKRRETGAITNINDHMQQVVSGSVSSVNDNYR